MSELLLQYVEATASAAAVWGPLLILLLMTIESSFIPFPSEIVMIPAGFLAARGELPPGDPLLAAALSVVCGVAGSQLGAYLNYGLALWLGRPVLHRYGHWVLLSPATLERSEAIFREYGDIATFVSRLIPGIRQLISIPAGLAQMSLLRFTVFTALGAGIWVLILTAIGYQLGVHSRDLGYPELLARGHATLRENALWVALGCAGLVAAWVSIHRRALHG